MDKSVNKNQKENKLNLSDYKDKDKDVFIGPKEFVSHMMMMLRCPTQGRGMCKVEADCHFAWCLMSGLVMYLDTKDWLHMALNVLIEINCH